MMEKEQKTNPRSVRAIVKNAIVNYDENDVMDDVIALVYDAVQPQDVHYNTLLDAMPQCFDMISVGYRTALEVCDYVDDEAMRMKMRIDGDALKAKYEIERRANRIKDAVMLANMDMTVQTSTCTICTIIDKRS